MVILLAFFYFTIIGGYSIGFVNSSKVSRGSIGAPWPEAVGSVSTPEILLGRTADENSRMAENRPQQIR